MVKRFEFQNNNLELDIAGNLFEVDIADTDLMTQMTEFGSEARAFADELSKKAKEDDTDYGKVLEEAIQFVVDAIDMTLGEGASEKIFKGRKVSFFDALDVMNFVAGEYNATREKNFSKYSPNRAQRRSK